MAGTIHVASAKPASELTLQSSDSITIREFKKENLERYFSNEEYRYDREFIQTTTNLRVRFKKCIFDKIINV